MKWTTANVKNPNYNGNHEIYVGTQTGSFKKLVPAYEDNPFTQKNLIEINKLDKDSRITALAYGNEAQSEILIGRAQTSVEVHSLKTEQIELTAQFKAAPVVGLARYGDEQLIAGISNGQVQSIVLNSNTPATEICKTGDDMAHLRQCSVVRNLIATGGKGRQNNLKVYDLAADGKQLFTSKNLPNDFLQLEVPVWDSDVGFIDGPHTLATCSRYGYVRVYDTRKQRRPVQHFATEDPLSFTTLVAHGNYVYTGTTTGALKAFDIRRMKNFVHTYKGFTGGISDLHLDNSGQYLTSSSLDRYVRVHDANSTVLLYQCYVKSKATRVLIREAVEDLNAAAAADNATEIDENVDSKTNKKLKASKTESQIDEEYENMFDNMQTICENTEADAENDEDADSTDSDSTADKTETPSKKRKITTTAQKIKKKK